MYLFWVVLGLPYCAGFSLAEASGAAPTVARASPDRVALVEPTGHMRVCLGSTWAP